MSRTEANEIVLRLLAKYEDRIAEAPKGKPFQECYNPRTARPNSWYLDMFQKVKGELAEMGLEFPY